MIEFAFLLLLLIGLTLKSIRRNKSISPVLAISLAIYVLFWNAFPFLYCTIMNNRTYDIISNPTHQKVIVIQLISVFIVLTLLNILGKFQPKHQWLPYVHQKNTNINLILVLLVVALTTLLFTNIYSIITIGLTFLERVQYAVSDINKENTVGAFLSAIKSYTMPFAIACIFSELYTLRNNQWIVRLSISIIAIHTCFMIIFGMRSFIFLPIVLIVIYWKKYTPRLKITTKIAVVAVILTLILMAPFLSMSLRSIRAMESYNVKDIIDSSPSEFFSTLGEFTLSTFDDIYTKFNSFEQGTILLEIEGTSRAGLSLITSSLASPIPRILYPDKPVPFSSNGEYSGVPYYLVPHLRGIVFAGHVVPIPPSTIALWELGYIGLFVMILFNVANLLFMNFFLKSELLLYNTVGFFMFSMPTFEFLLAPTGWIIKDGLRILILIFIIKLLLFIGNPKKKVPILQYLQQKSFTNNIIR